MKQHNKTGLFNWLKGFMFSHLHNMITCREFDDFMLAYLDDQLPAQQRNKFELHLRMCRQCREYLQAYKRSMAVSRAVCSIADDTVPADVPEDLIKAILKVGGDFH